MPGLAIKALHQPWGAVLTCQGSLDQSTAESFRRELAQCLWNGTPRIEIDLIAASFRDCSAVQPLLEAQRELSNRNGTLRVIAGPRTAFWLEQLGLNDILECTLRPPGVEISRSERSAPSHSNPQSADEVTRI